jgi:beta-galactosidase
MTSRPQWIRWPDAGIGGRGHRLAFGGDYNPEQWPETVWREDVDLMQRAGVNLVSVGIFSWALLERRDGHFEFNWLDRILDILHGAGIAVDLANGTASPPPWLVHAHPEILPVDDHGHTLSFGGRQSWCPSSPVFRTYALRLTEQIARRYAGHPALAMWHVSNELGCHNSRCYCDVSADAFTGWLTSRYRGDIEALNFAWGTAFWSQHYTEFEQIRPPRMAPTHPNPGQQLDFARFYSDALLEQYLAERAVLQAVTPDLAITTNFMVTGLDVQGAKHMDYAGWADQMDLVSNDHYLREGDTEPQIELALSADIVRGINRGRPWMLMEHATSAVNWGQVNRPKSPGELRRHSLSNLARGADAICFFQWRASRAGAEKFHSAMLPHAGANSRVFTEICALGADLQTLGEVATSVVTAEVALLFDWPSWWASELDSHPSQQFSYRQTVLAHYAAFWRSGVCCDVVPVDADLSNYRIVVVPALYMVDDATADRVKDVTQRGGTVVVTYFSGIVDTADHIRLGGYPGAFRDLLGISVEEFGPLAAGEEVRVDDGSVATRWTEDLTCSEATAVLRYIDGPFPGRPAVTRRLLAGGGSAWYLATQLPPAGLATIVDRICADAGVRALVSAADGVEAVRRSHADGRSYLFLINHGHAPAQVAARGIDLLTGQEYPSGSVPVLAGGVVVLLEHRTPTSVN